MRGRVLEGVSEFWRVCRIKIPNPGSCIISNTWMTHVRWKALFIFQNHSKDSSFGGSLFSPESPYLQNVCCSVKKPLVQQWTEHARNAWYFPPRKFGSLESSPSLRDLVWWMMLVTLLVWFHWDVRDGAILDILNHPHSFGCLASFGSLGLVEKTMWRPFTCASVSTNPSVTARIYRISVYHYIYIDSQLGRFTINA